MAGRDHDDDYFDEIKHHEEFVLDEGHHTFGDYEEEEEEVTYRRAPNLGGTAFVGNHFSALDDDMFHPLAAKSEAKNPTFTSERPLVAPVAVVEVKGSSELEPTGPVPVAASVVYHEVNPMFESDAQADEIFRQLKASIRPYVVEFQCFADWTIDAFALVAAEEVFFTVQLHRIPSKNSIRVDFNLREGDDYQFLEIVDKIRKECRELDRELAQLPDFSLDIFSSWSSSDELFPGSMTVDEQDLVLLVEDIMSPYSHPFTRYEACKQLKDYCQHASNRETFRRSLLDRLVSTLELMLQDNNEDIVRFAIFVILNFAQDQASWSGMNFPALPQILQTIEQTVQKRSTKKLASDLHTAIISQASSIAVGGH